MAVATPTNLTKSGSSTGASSYNTASVSPGANRLQLLTVASRTGITANSNQPTVTGCGLTWVAIATVVYDDTSSSRKRVTLFRALGASPSSGALTIDFGGQSQTHCQWNLDESASGFDTSGTNGSGAIVQSVTNKDSAGTATTLTGTLAAFGSANNATYGACVNGGASSSLTQGSGFTKIADDFTSANLDVMTEFRSDNDTTVDFSCASGDELGIIAIEIKASGTAFTKTLTETVTHSDTLAKLAGKVLSETETNTDTLNKTTSKTRTETVTLTDTLLKQAGKLFSEVTSYTDSLVVKVTGKTLSEIISHTDTLIRGSTKVLTETITHTDTFLKQLARSLIETITSTDTLIRLPSKVLSETITYTDSVIRTIAKFLAETVTHTDSLIRGLSFGRVFTEIVSLTDTFTRIIGKVFTETLSLLDTIQKLLNGLSTFFSDKFSSRSTSFSDKYSNRGSSYSDKYSGRSTTYDDKYPPLGL